MTDQPGAAFGGIDWATDDHAVCVVDDAGEIRDEFVVDHSEPGLRHLCNRLLDNDVQRVAIERPDGPVVDALMDAGFEVVVVVSRSVKAFRERYSTSGSKSGVATPTSSPTAYAPTGIVGRACNQTPQPRSLCDPMSVPASTWSKHASRSRTSSEHTCRSTFQLLWGCSATLTARCRASSCAGSRPRTSWRG